MLLVFEAPARGLREGRPGGSLSDAVWQQVLEALKATEDATQSKFGDARNPLLVSVRSGAAVSMPGSLPTHVTDLECWLAKPVTGVGFAYPCQLVIVQC